MPLPLQAADHVVSTRPRGLAARRWTIALLIGIALLTLAPFAAPLGAQVQVNYGPGMVGAYRRALVGYFQQSNALVDEIALISIAATYCSAADRNAAGEPLAAAQAKFATLREAYNDWKADINRQMAVQSIYAQFEAAGYDPGGPQFWKIADEEILRHPAADLEAKQKRWTASRVIDCSPRRPTTAAQPPRRTEPPRQNPLAGLTRPTVPPYSAVPALPPPFCSYTALWAWHDVNLKPLLDGYREAGWALLIYGQTVHERLDARRTAGDTVAVRALSNELKWVDQVHRETDAHYWELARLRDQLTVIDCTPPKRAEDPVKPTTEVGEGPKIEWRLGGSVDYASFPDFTKVAGDQPRSTGANGKSGTVGYGLTIGIDTKKWRCGLGAHFNELTYDQSFDSPPATDATHSGGTLSGQFYDLSCGPRWRVGPLLVNPYGGATYAVDELEIFSSFAFGVPITEIRKLRNWKTHAGASVELPVTDRFNLRLDLTHTLGKWSGDADRNTRLGFGVQVRPFGTPIF